MQCIDVDEVVVERQLIKRKAGIRIGAAVPCSVAIRFILRYLAAGLFVLSAYRIDADLRGRARTVVRFRSWVTRRARAKGTDLLAA